jgi:pimeloyl-ACP methyl ester carboxylesterase
MKGRLSEMPLRIFSPQTTAGASRLRVVTPDEIEGREARLPVRPRLPRCRPAAQPKPSGPSLFRPQGYEAGYRYPLLVWIPDATRPFDLGTTMGRLSLRNYVAVEMPAAPADADQAMWDAVDRASASANIHSQRIFLCGAGQGGTMALRLACRYAAEVAGAVSLGGPFPLDEGSLSRLADVRRLPMLLCTDREGCEREATSIDRTLRVFHAAGATLAMRVYPTTSRLTRSVLEDVNRWLMDCVVGQPASTPSLTY